MGLFQLFRTLFQIFGAYRRATKSLEGCERARMLDPVTQAFRQGQYEQVKSLSTDPFMQALALIQLDRAAEAEPMLRQLAQNQQQPKLLGLIESVLGQIMLRQQRYDEAMACFQRALRLWPERGSTHRDIAEWWLRRGGNNDEALRWARLAVEKEKAGPGLSADSKAICLGEDLATLSWAAAVQSHSPAEVDRLCEQVAFPAIVPVSSIAQVQVHFGKAFAELGDAAQSAVHFEHAARVDPNGVWGREAASMVVASHK